MDTLGDQRHMNRRTWELRIAGDAQMGSGDTNNPSTSPGRPWSGSFSHGRRRNRLRPGGISKASGLGNVVAQERPRPRAQGCARQGSPRGQAPAPRALCRR